MQSYTELTPPTAVTHSLSLPFFSSTANNLIVIKTSLLQIFSLKSTITISDDLSAGRPSSETNKTLVPARPERSQTTKLVLLAEYELAGTVTSIARVKISQSKSGGDSLLVALRDAKLSLIEWDPQRYSISTISIHYYEREDIISSPWEPHLTKCGTILSVDPSSRCAVFKFGVRHIAILPFHQVGDDVAMDDYDPELDGEKLDRNTSIPKAGKNEVTKKKTPFAASFVLSLLALDPVLIHPVHLTFLYEYREPTFGILSSQNATSASLLGERRDIMSYAVYNLDLEQRASTTLLSVTNLPYDLFKIIPLSRVIGGALLVGANQLIHVDQSGKTNGIAVNEAAKHCTSFAMADQSSLDLRLESCLVKQLGSETPELLVIEAGGALLILSFKIDGRSVSGLQLRRVEQSPPLANPSCASSVGRGRMFVGSEQSDSVVLGWSKPSDRLKQQKSRTGIKVGVEEELTDISDIDVEEDEDDLYGDDKPSDALKPVDTVSHKQGPEDDYKFRLHDALMNIGPLSDVTFGKCHDSNADKLEYSSLRNELLATSGQGASGFLSSIQTAIVPQLTHQSALLDIEAIWSINAKKAQRGRTADISSMDRYLFTAENHGTGLAKTNVYSLPDMKEVENTDFEPDAGSTLGWATLNGSTMIVQVLPTEVRAFDSDLGLAQIIDLDEEGTSSCQVLRISYADPYLLLVKDDQNISIYAADESGDLVEVNQSDATKSGNWHGGSLYDDSNDALRLDFPEDEDEVSNVLLFLLSASGGLHVFRLPSLQTPVFVADGLSFLPPFLSPGFIMRRTSAREAIAEMLVAELGDTTHRAPYLILRTTSDDLVIYQPYQAPIDGSKDTSLRFLKIPHTYCAPTREEGDAEEEDVRKRQPLRILADLHGYSAVWIPGSPSHFIIKPSVCQPQIIPIVRSIQSLCPLNTSSNPSGFGYATATSVSLATLPYAQGYTTGLPIARIPLNNSCNALAYHSPSKSYVLSLLNSIPFKLPSEPSLHAQISENEPLLPTVESSTLALFDRCTSSIIQTRVLDPYETILCLRNIDLEVSEISHERQPLICVGTCLLRGEDLPCVGRIYVFSLIDVVPNPDKPETGKALKLIAKEEVKGAVTDLSPVGTQGFLMVSQGQKVLVRGLKEDGSLLPVAFWDTMVQTSVARALGGTGLVVVGDCVGGVWFGGYTEDPYQLRLFAKSPYKIEVITAEFLPDGQNLYIVAADADGALHVLQYDPENPTTLAGSLLHPSQSPPFHTPHYPSTLTLIPPSGPSPPSSLPLDENASPVSPVPLPGFPPGALLSTSTTGAIALITPLPQNTYRVISSLQNHLFSTLPAPLGLNPRAFRQAISGARLARTVGRGVGAGMLDGNLLRRWQNEGTWRWWAGEGRDVVKQAVAIAVGSSRGIGSD